MRLATLNFNGRIGVAAVADDSRLFGCYEDDASYPGDLDTLICRGADLQTVGAALLKMRPIGEQASFAPVLCRPSKIICIGLNYVDHSLEAGFTPPPYPTVFARFPSSLLGHKQPVPMPKVSDEIDYEGELVAVIGKAGRNIPKAEALNHIAGYSIFNDISVRDFQFKSPQWTVGKNFDGTGAFGPFLVTPDELPPGCKGLELKTVLNGTEVQKATTNDMIFDIASLIEILSEAMTLLPGDVIVSGTPAGVGMARTPKLFMKPGDECSVSIEGIGTLTNRIAA